jgi:hypothetical protein
VSPGDRAPSPDPPPPPLPRAHFPDPSPYRRAGGGTQLGWHGGLVILDLLWLARALPAPRPPEPARPAPDTPDDDDEAVAACRVAAALERVVGGEGVAKLGFDPGNDVRKLRSASPALAACFRRIRRLVDVQVAYRGPCRRAGSETRDVFRHLSLPSY